MKEIESWRERLAIALFTHNPDLKQQELNIAVRAIINRLIFLRICEDRGIEPHEQLRSLTQHSQIYQRLCLLFQSANDRYPSSLFHFKPEQGRPAPDQLTLHLIIPDQPLQQMIQTLYYPDSLYEFSVMPIELLGQVYERLLGKEIQLTPEHGAIVEDKPEARKASGVYYTPAYVVDYLVQNTVGQLLEGKTPKQAEKIRVLDPSCGSGSFLIGAYQFLLNWYLQQYLADPQKHRQELYRDKRNHWRLTAKVKQRILLNHIHGIDIDLQAVETTKLSLLLQVLEGEEIYPETLSPLQARELLDLNKNIKWGNALIGSDYYDRVQSHVQDETALYPIDIFDWENEFPEIMRSGGFDAVIGNPPWVFTRDVKFGETIKKYYQTKYLAEIETTQQGKTKQTGKVNLFAIFLLEFIKLLNPQGLSGIILPNTILRTTVYDGVRKYVLDHCSIERIVDLGSSVFERVTASTVILILGKNLAQDEVQFFRGISRNPGTSQTDCFSVLSKRDFLKNTSYVFSVFLTNKQSDLFEKLDSVSIKFSQIAREIIEGIVCKREQVLDRAINDRCKRLLEGKDIDRYAITFRERYVVFDREKIHRPRPDFVWMAKEKIILRRIGGGKFSLVGVLDTENYYAFASTNSILLKENCPYNIKFILGLLNSRLLNYYYTQKFTNQSTLTVNISKTFIEQLPIRAVAFNHPSDHAQHDRLVSLVEQMLALHKQFAATRTLPQKQIIQRQINVTDRQIDQLVYSLYGLTPAEIAIVEGKTD